MRSAIKKKKKMKQTKGEIEELYELSEFTGREFVYSERREFFCA